MAIKTTMKALKENYKVYSVGYCDLQHLFNYENPVFYNSGTYGWNFDVYIFDRIAICTGYRNLGAHIDYKIVKEYEKKAHEFRGKKEDLDRLIIEFLEVIK